MMTDSCLYETPTESHTYLLVREPYILCVEDERPIVGLVCDALQTSGYQVIKVASSQAGLNLIHTYKPDVILLDLTSRGSAGWALYQAIRRDKTLASIPIIDVSPRRSEVRHKSVHEFPPIDDYEAQPVDIERLIHSIKILAHR